MKIFSLSEVDPGPCRVPLCVRSMNPKGPCGLEETLKNPPSSRENMKAGIELFATGCIVSCLARLANEYDIDLLNEILQSRTS